MYVIPQIYLKVGTPQDYDMIPPGESVEIANDQEALKLITIGHAKKDESRDSSSESELALDSVAQGTDLIEAIVDAIADLNESDFGTDGKPKVKPLEAVLGQGITAADRDAAWEEYQRLTTENGNE